MESRVVQCNLDGLSGTDRLCTGGAATRPACTCPLAPASPWGRAPAFVWPCCRFVGDAVSHDVGDPLICRAVNRAASGHGLQTTLDPLTAADGTDEHTGLHCGGRCTTKLSGRRATPRACG